MNRTKDDTDTRESLVSELAAMLSSGLRHIRPNQEAKDFIGRVLALNPNVMPDSVILMLDDASQTEITARRRELSNLMTESFRRILASQPFQIGDVLQNRASNSLVQIIGYNLDPLYPREAIPIAQYLTDQPGRASSQIDIYNASEWDIIRNDLP